MLNLDGGHYFLTVLAPVLVDPWVDGDGVITSPTAALREVLATLPTAAQSPACIAGGRDSPFSRCTRTHFTRLVVIDQPAFNGRNPADSIVDAIRKTDLLKRQPVDSLATAWLAWIVDFDPDPALAATPDQGLGAYCEHLWGAMGDELTAIFRHCYGFERVKDGAGFAAYIRRCQVPTTMPFNDYWITPPPLPSISLAGLGIGVGLGTLGLTGLAVWQWGWWGLLALPPALALSGWLAYLFVMARGGKPFGTAPNSDLRSVLKSLYLQQHFARFALANQGAEPGALHAAFGDFLAAHLPDNRDTPTQAPGVIRS